MGMWEKGKAKVALPMNDDLQSRVVRALHLLSSITGATLGPGGRPILLERDGLPPLITKDGVTVAKAINQIDAVDNIVIECVKEVADRTGKQAGDGTTTSVILAEALVRYGLEYIKQHKQESPQRVVRQLMKDFVTLLKPRIAELSTAIVDTEQMRQIALISSNGDEVVADCVVSAVKSSGDDGVIMLEESSGKDTNTKVQDGFAIAKGLDFLGSLGPQFFNNERDLECVLDRPLILTFNGTLRDAQQVVPLIQANMNTQSPRSMVFVAHDFSDEIKSLFALNFKGGAIKMVPVMTPRDGTPMGRELLLKDLAAYTNAEYLDPVSIKDAKLESLGDCDLFKMSRWQTIFIGEPDQQALQERIDAIKSQLEHVAGELDAEIYRERIARLTGGVTTIYIGGLSDLEVRETKARVDDAICAVRSALKQGVVAGGAATFLRLAEEAIHPVLKAALEAPFKKLLENAGVENVQELMQQIKQGDGIAYNVVTNELVDAYKDGLIDPAKVIETSIGNALSVANTLMTLGGMVVVPRDIALENQAALSKQAFDSMMAGGLPNGL
jgi:chaperonin GroEL